MDTIQISIKLNEEITMRIAHRDLQELRKFIDNIQSIYGHSYCDCLEVSVTSNLIVKISYPRYFAGINAYLITDEKQCLEVQNHFYHIISRNSLLSNAIINLNRVDIPFTFIMDYNFYSYRKIYQIFNYIYKRKNIKASPKAFADIENFKEETLIYADTKSISSYNSKIMIYDQYNNIRAKTKTLEDLEIIKNKYQNISKRMRIEVSKRIRRKPFTLFEFADFNILGEYLPKYKNYVLENILDLNEVENFYNESTNKLITKLIEYKKSDCYFNYENFILRNISNIYDYEIIKRALKICISNIKTRESAITRIRKVLKYYEEDTNTIVMNTYSVIKKIREVIQNY